MCIERSVGRVDRTGMDDASVFEHNASPRASQHKIEVLFNEQHSELRLVT